MMCLRLTFNENNCCCVVLFKPVNMKYSYYYYYYYSYLKNYFSIYVHISFNMKYNNLNSKFITKNKNEYDDDKACHYSIR